MAPLLLLLAALAMQAPVEVVEAVEVTTTAELRTALAAARPGTRILLRPGDYGSLHVSGVRGERERPVVVTAADPERPPVFRAGVQFSRAAFLELSHLVIEGAPANGLNIDDGGELTSPSHDLLLKHLVVRDCGKRGNEDGIKLSGVTDFRLEHCTVERWGRGGSGLDMVGCRRGVIEECTFRDREEDPAASGVQAKGGSRDIAIRRSRFEHAGRRAINLGGSTAMAWFRPQPEGFEAKDLLVERCTFVGSDAPIAFVGVDGASVRWNTFHRPRRWLLRILQETVDERFVPCRGGVFSDNLIVWRSDEVAIAVNVGPHTAAETFVLARNYWHCLDAPDRVRPPMPLKEIASAGGKDPLLLDAASGDLRPADSSPASGYGAHAAESSRGR